MLNHLVNEIIRLRPDYIGMDAVIGKEILHLDVLEILLEEGFLEKLIFIGGTSLRLCFNSNRLSEDLDFTGGCYFKPQDFSGLAKYLETKLSEKYNIEVIAKEPTNLKGNTSTWKITLFTQPERADLPAQRMHIDVCAIESIEKIKRPIINHYQVNSSMTARLIPVQSLEELLADKMVALAYRERRIKPRDVWDIVWLKQQGIKQNIEYLQKKLVMRSKEKYDFLHKLKQRATNLPDKQVQSDFENEMKRFLPASISERTIQQVDFYPYVCRVILEELSIIEHGFLGNTNKSKWDM